MWSFGENGNGLAVQYAFAEQGPDRIILGRAAIGEVFEPRLTPPTDSCSGPSHTNGGCGASRRLSKNWSFCRWRLLESL